METKAPFIIDSLDKPNAGRMPPNNQKPRDYTGVVVGAMSIIAVLLVLLFVWVIRSLQQGAYEGSTFDNAMLVLLKAAPVIALTIGLIAGVVYGVKWLKAWADQKNLVSALGGPHYRANDVKLAYAEIFNTLRDLSFAVQQERAKQSIYGNVQTLTLDQSTSSSTSGENKGSSATPLAPIALAELEQE